MALLSWYFVYTQLIENVNGNKKLNHMKIERKTWEDSQENGKKSGKKNPRWARIMHQDLLFSQAPPLLVRLLFRSSVFPA